jgi:drug/metabolite transporter (DMT)-like permease
MVDGQTLVMVSARLIDARRSTAFILLNPTTATVLGVLVLGEMLRAWNS